MIEAVVAASSYGGSGGSIGVFKDGNATVTTSLNDVVTNMQVSFPSGGAGDLNNIHVFHFENANGTATRTYDIRAVNSYLSSSDWNLFVNNNYYNNKASVSYMTVKEVLGEEVVSFTEVDPTTQSVSSFAPSQDEEEIPTIDGDDAQSQLDEHLAMIQQLQQELQELKGLTSHQELVNRIEVDLENSVELEEAYISQNMPNPTNSEAIIKYYLPENSGNAIVRFFSLSGQVMKEVDLENKGQGEIKVNLHRMATGSYMYALIVDGELIDTKTMVVVK